METENPKVAALWIAWLMLKEHGFGNVSSAEKPKAMREAFQANYKAIVEVAELDSKATAARG